ncbi:hypothetical protein DSECCO2_355550 [anaerobic digester metagenome]
MKNILVFFLLLAIVPMCTANSLYIEQDEAAAFITFSSDQPTNIAAYVLQLNFSPGTNIVALEPEPPFMGAVNIVQEGNYAKISGFTTEPALNNRLATVSYTGGGEPEIIVIELYDSDSKPVAVTNRQMTPPATPTATPASPIYNPNPGYVSPGTSGWNTNKDVTGGTQTFIPQESTPITSGVAPPQTLSPQEDPSTASPVRTPTHESQASPAVSEGKTVIPTTQKSPIDCFVLHGALIFQMLADARRKKPL